MGDRPGEIRLQGDNLVAFVSCLPIFFVLLWSRGPASEGLANVGASMKGHMGEGLDGRESRATGSPVCRSTFLLGPRKGSSWRFSGGPQGNMRRCRTIRPSPPFRSQTPASRPVIIIYIHGDLSDGSPADYIYQRTTEEVAATGPIGGKGRTNERIGWGKHDDTPRSSKHVTRTHPNS